MTAAERSRVLIFEPEHLGHQPAYVRALADWMERNPQAYEVNFLVGQPLLERLRLEDGLELEQGRSYRVRTLTEQERAACSDAGMAAKALARWRTLRWHAAAIKARHIHALFLDPLQLPLALGLAPGRGCTLSGILFRPSVHGLGVGSVAAPLRERVRDALKRALYDRMLRNPSLTTALSLDPFFAEFARRRFRGGEKVLALPDPVVEEGDARGEIGEDVRCAPADGRAMFLMFGALAERKGVIEVLEALLALPPERRARMRLVLAGRIDVDCATRVSELTRRLAAVDPRGQSLHIVDRFLSTAELAWLVSRSDVVLATYRRHVGSSGALLWAAHHRKPVLAQDYGLVGALTREFHLGPTVDAEQAPDIAAAMGGMIEDARRASIAAAAQWSRFLSGRTADDFAMRIGQTIREAA